MRRDYRPPRYVRETPAPPPTELEVQALWFEQFYKPSLVTDDGRVAEIVQPGFCNHAAGPDFSRAALRWKGSPETVVGDVEVHLRADDWHLHGHDADPAYERAILHVVWEAKKGPVFFPATASFRRVPQVVLVAPWEELRPLCADLMQHPLPGAVPGRCSSILAGLPAARVLDILRTAGLFRLRQKARRWHWRREIAGRDQALFEALAEALGFHANQVPMRLVAQRLPYALLRKLTPAERQAHLFGLAGFLPEESVALLRAEPRGWVRDLWEIWWKARAPLDYALLGRSHWKLAGLRPLNRPERRLAALAQIVAMLPKLGAALERRDDARFAGLLLGMRDEFWEKHATLTGSELPAPCRLLGEERAHDILINVFWPLVSLDDPAGAERGLTALNSAPNNAARIATQRMLLAPLTAKQQREALVQQGLLQIYRDYCLTDCSQCEACTFPELVSSWDSLP
jgi:hypothetical protein